MENYYITKYNEKIEIIDNEIINLSNQNIKEIYISNLPNCEILYLQNNSLTTFKADLSDCNFATNCKYLFLYNNSLKSFKANLPNCKTLDLSNNCLKLFKADLPNCKILYLHGNDLLSYKRLNNNITLYI